MSLFEDWLNAEIASQRRIVLSNIQTCRDALDHLEARINLDSYLNDLGELQASGPMLDASVAKLAALRSALKNHQEMPEVS